MLKHTVKEYLLYHNLNKLFPNRNYILINNYVFQNHKEKYYIKILKLKCLYFKSFENQFIECPPNFLFKTIFTIWIFMFRNYKINGLKLIKNLKNFLQCLDILNQSSFYQFCLI